MHLIKPNQVTHSKHRSELIVCEGKLTVNALCGGTGQLNPRREHGVVSMAEILKSKADPITRDRELQCSDWPEERSAFQELSEFNRFVEVF